jgi:hypothetical protein
VLDAVEQMDLSVFEAAYRTGGAGQAPFAPAMPIFDSWGRRAGVKAADFLGSGVDRAQNVVPRRE